MQLHEGCGKGGLGECSVMGRVGGGGGRRGEAGLLDACRASHALGVAGPPQRVFAAESWGVGGGGRVGIEARGSTGFWEYFERALLFHAVISVNFSIISQGRGRLDEGSLAELGIIFFRLLWIAAAAGRGRSISTFARTLSTTSPFRGLFVACSFIIAQTRCFLISQDTCSPSFFFNYRYIYI